MRKIIFIGLSLWFITSITVFAQFNFGIKGGVNYSKIKAENKEVDESGILGYHVGLFARAGGLFYIQPEVYLGSKNADVKFTTSGSTVEQNGRAKFTTLDVPVLLGGKLGISKYNIRVMAGPSFQYNLSSDESAFKQAVNLDFYKYKDFVTNVQAGAGVDVGALTFDFRYEKSLGNVNEGDNQKQNLIHLSLGFKLL